jgi:hypothetical protein
VDETGWRTAGERRVLWGAFTKRHAFFQVIPDRHEDHAKSLLAHRRSSPRIAGGHTRTCRLPVASSAGLHLKRDFQAHGGLAAEKEFGDVGLELCERVVSAWEVFAHTHEHRELKLTIRRLRTYKPITL